MIRGFFLLALSASAVLTFITPSSAQAIIPPFPQGPKAKLPNGFEELQRALQMQREEALQALQQQALQQRQRPDGRLIDGSMTWGGAHLSKADANLQQQLGLEEKEGMVITSIDPKSPADKAGLKASDVLVKVNGKPAPNDLDGFTKLVKDQKVDEAAEFVVVRKGKEETLKGAKMPTLVQANIPAGGVRPGGGRLGGGAFIPPIRIYPRDGRLNPIQPARIIKSNVEMEINGAKVVKKQDGDQFSGEYVKDDVHITVSGKIENGQPRPGEVTVTQGKETKKYATPREVPAQYHDAIRMMMPSSSPFNGLLLLPDLQGLRNFPGLPVIPGIDE